MGNATKHDMTDFINLLNCGPIEFWVIVTMDGAPPRRHTIDQLSPIGKMQPDTLG
jgi:hypothetical protein